MFAGPREGARERKGILKTFLSSFFYTFLGAYSSRVNRKCCVNSHTPLPLSPFLFLFKSLAYVSMCISFYCISRFSVSYHNFLSCLYNSKRRENTTSFFFPLCTFPSSIFSTNVPRHCCQTSLTLGLAMAPDSSKELQALTSNCPRAMSTVPWRRSRATSRIPSRAVTSSGKVAKERNCSRQRGLDSGYSGREKKRNMAGEIFVCGVEVIYQSVCFFFFFFHYLSASISCQEKITFIYDRLSL